MNNEEKNLPPDPWLSGPEHAFEKLGSIDEWDMPLPKPEYYSEESQDELPFTGSMLPAVERGMTKTKIADLVDRYVTDLCESGTTKPLELAEVLSVMDKVVEATRKDPRFRQLVLDELAKHPGKVFTSPSGAILEQTEVGVKFDYTTNSEWVELTKKIDDLTFERKQLEARLKSIGEGQSVVDTESGEVTDGVKKKSTTTFRVSLAR